MYMTQIQRFRPLQKFTRLFAAFIKYYQLLENTYGAWSASVFALACRRMSQTLSDTTLGRRIPLNVSVTQYAGEVYIYNSVSEHAQVMGILAEYVEWCQKRNLLYTAFALIHHQAYDTRASPNSTTTIRLYRHMLDRDSSMVRYRLASAVANTLFRSFCYSFSSSFCRTFSSL